MLTTKKSTEYLYMHALLAILRATVYCVAVTKALGKRHLTLDPESRREKNGKQRPASEHLLDHTQRGATMGV